MTGWCEMMTMISVRFSQTLKLTNLLLQSSHDYQHVSQQCQSDIAYFSNNRSSTDPLYKFPRGSSGRTFQHQWLNKYPWLKYSKQENGGYCLPCVLFSRNSSFRADPGVLVSTHWRYQGSILIRITIRMLLLQWRCDEW